MPTQKLHKDYIFNCHMFSLPFLLVVEIDIVRGISLAKCLILCNQWSMFDLKPIHPVGTSIVFADKKWNVCENDETQAMLLTQIQGFKLHTIFTCCHT